MFASDVAVILAEAGRDELTLARVEQNLRRFPGDLWTQIHAGDVHLTLSDPARAEQTFRDALAKSRSRGDASGIADANERLSRLLGEQPGREQEAAAAEQESLGGIVWVGLLIRLQARKRHHLSDAHVQMARELGMNPTKLGSVDNHRQEPWKAPLPEFIESLYFKRFGREQPGIVVSIGQRARQLRQQKADRKATKTARRSDPSMTGDGP